MLQENVSVMRKTADIKTIPFNDAIDRILSVHPSHITSSDWEFMSWRTDLTVYRDPWRSAVSGTQIVPWFTEDYPDYAKLFEPQTVEQRDIPPMSFAFVSILLSAHRTNCKWVRFSYDVPPIAGLWVLSGADNDVTTIERRGAS